MRRPRGTGRIYLQKDSSVWWIKFYRNGEPFRESTGTSDKRKATRALNLRLAEVTTGNFIGPSVERTRVTELAEDFLRDYRINGKASLLSLFSIEYCIPVFDLGVKIDSKDGVIRSIPGRITTLMPGLPCLYCRHHITAEGVAAEQLQELAPEEANARRREGYIPELPDAEPAVIAFTTATAALAIGELLNRLTGFKDEDYQAGELLIRFDESAIRKPGTTQIPGCFCTDAHRIGRGDQRRFLGQTWREE